MLKETLEHRRYLVSSKKVKRSGFEVMCGAVLEPAGFEYEPYSVQYVVHHGYTPDFMYEVRGDYRVLVECKGWFRPGDRHKYKAIRDSLARDDKRDWPEQELVFLLYAPKKKVSKGAQLTMAGWCDKEGLKHFSSPTEVVEYVNGLQ